MRITQGQRGPVRPCLAGAELRARRAVALCGSILVAVVSFSHATSLPPGWIAAGRSRTKARSHSSASRSHILQRLAQEEAATATEAPAADSEELLIGSWRYVGGVYEIKREEGKLLFQEHVGGELQKQADGWYQAVLPKAGTIKLRHEQNDTIISQFRLEGANESDFGDEILARREWETLAARTAHLEKELLDLEFVGSSADGSVVVTVNGKQRPQRVSLSDAAAKSPQISALIREAYNKAIQKSLYEMAEKLRRVYTSHSYNQDMPA